jgi:VanZ family protein
MKLLRRHKSVLLALGIYWPFIFWLTHIPVPALARQSGMSDKTMHVMAYFVLTFLVWFAVSPYEKVRWNRTRHWFVALAVIVYAALDELLQSRVGRSSDIYDFAANGLGVALALGVLSIFEFWLALLTVSAVFIFVLSDMSRLMTLPQYAGYATAFHFTAYTAFTLIWIQWLQRFGRFTRGTAGWFGVSLAAPAGLLLGVKAAAPLWGRPFNGFDFAIAVFGICAAIVVSWAVFKMSRRASGSQE